MTTLIQNALVCSVIALAASVSMALSVSIAAAQEEDQRVQFQDIGAATGIDFLHTNGRAGELYVIEVKGSGVAFVDYDNDDLLDVYAVNGNNLPGAKTDIPPINHLYRNNGDGTFTDVTEDAGVGDGGYGHGVATADYDNDGDQDIYIANYGPNVLYRNNGDGTFTDFTGEAGVAGDVWTASAAFCDVDNDGLLDLYVANYLVFDINSKVRLPNGPAFYDGETDVLYLNNGDGTFRDVTRENIGEPNGKGLGVVCFDYDEDGDLEIYVANDGTPNSLYENQGGGVFEDVTLFSGTGVNGAGAVQAGMGVDAADYDDDGDMDLFVTNYKNDHNTLMRNDGGGIFTDVSSRADLVAPSLPYVTFGTGFFDADNDGDLDIYVANGHTEEYEADHEQPDQLFENIGDGRFEDVSALSGPPFAVKYVGRGVAFGDYDNDGDIDLVVSNKNGPLNFLQNQGGNRRNWLMIRTRGTASNRDGIGARIEVSAPDFSRVKEVKSGYSMFSSNDLRVHFGLGDLERVDVTIRWPSGTVDTLTDVPANRLLTIVEGSGQGSVSELRAIETDYDKDLKPMLAESAADPEVIDAQVQRLREMLDSGSGSLDQYLISGNALRTWIANRTDRRYQALIAADPGNVENLREYGFFLTSLSRFDEAIDAFRQALAERPEAVDSQMNLTALYLRTGRFEQAVESARRVLALGEDTPAAQLQLGKALAAAKRTDEAESVLNEVIRRNPRLVDAYLTLGKLYTDSEQMSEALDAYRAAAKLTPASRNARYQLAEAYRRVGDDEGYENQVRIFEMLETESSVFKGGMRREDEIELLHREIRMNPLFGRTRADRQLALRYGEIDDEMFRELYSLRGRASTIKDDLANVIDSFHRLLRLDSSPETRLQYEECNALRIKYVDAMNRATDYDYEQSSELLTGAQSALAAGRYDEALSGFRSALLYNPDNAEAYRGLAQLYMAAGLGLGPARGLARKAAQIDQSPESYTLLAEILSAMGDPDAARRAMQMASSDSD